LFSAKNSAVNSLFTLIARDTTLTRTSAKHGGEYSGPCPLCRKGSDRFKVWPALGRWGVGPAWLERLTLAPRVLVAFDVDANGAGDFRRAQVELEAWRAQEGLAMGSQEGGKGGQTLLVCVGADAALMVDVAALRAVKAATGLCFHRIRNVTRDNFDAYLRRERSKGRPVEHKRASTPALTHEAPSMGLAGTPIRWQGSPVHGALCVSPAVDRQVGNPPCR